LQLLFLDVWGPAPLNSVNNNRYYLSIVDDFSKYTWFYPLKLKYDVLATFLHFKQLVETYFGTKIISIQSDNGGEFRPLQTSLTTMGVSYRLSCPHTHHQMGFVERKHRHIVETGLTLLATSSAPLSFWDSAFETAVYLINRLPSKVTKQKSPFAKLFQISPDYKLLKIFGCECWPFLRPYNSTKLAFRSQSCVFIGYSKNHLGYKCLHIPSGRVYIARHVVFNEHNFPYSQSVPTRSPPHQLSSSVSIPLLIPATNPVSEPCRSTPENSHNSLPHHSPQPLIPFHSSTPSSSSIQALVPLNQPPPSRVHGMTTRSQNHIFIPTQFTDGRIRYPTPQALTVSLHNHEVEPTCYTQASKHVEWREAMNLEFDALLKNGTWSLVSPSSSMNIVGCKWIFRIRRKADGSIERYKARLVAKGFHQQPGIDFSETYSPVIKPITIRTILSLAVSAGWPVHQVDVSNAFLHGNLQESVYMEQPPGFQHPSHPTAVCKLHKALYGLKQAPRAWFLRLSARLTALNFKSSKADSSLFIYKANGIKIFVLIYVDDIIITSSHRGAISQLVQDLHSSFALKDLGPLNFFLGVEASWKSDGLHLSQQRYILDILKKTNMELVKPVSTPMSSSTKLSKFEGSTITDPTLYRSTVRSLQYLSLTRPDIAFAVNKVSQFMQDPREPHWTAIKRILRYLKATIEYTFCIHKLSSHQLIAFSDSDWAGCPDDHKSTSGYCVFLGKNLISWSSKKQPTVSCSSTESEYKALANAFAELIWIQTLLNELRISPPCAPTLFCDNIGATYLTFNPIYHARTKHIEIDYHFVRDQVTDKLLNVRFISGKDQIADVLTKPLPASWFLLLASNLNVRPPTSSLRGRISLDKSLSSDKD